MIVKINDPLPPRFATREAAIRAQENLDLSEMVPRGTPEYESARYEMALTMIVGDDDPIPDLCVKINVEFEKA